MIAFLRKIPMWALTLLLMVVSACSMVFACVVYAGAYIDMVIEVSTGWLVALVILDGVIYGFLVRLLARVIYAVADRVFFRAMHNVPDYNLRRLPLPYNDYLRCVLAALIVSKAVAAVLQIAYFAAPYATIVLNAVCNLVTLACLWGAYAVMSKANVPAWQSGKCCMAVMIPATVLVFVLCVLG